MEGQEKTLVVASHFNVGEVISDSSKELLQLARHEPGDLALFVGDIGFHLSLYEYFTKGIEGLLSIYQARIDCADNLCMSSQLPKNRAEIISTVNEDEYVLMISEVETHGQNALSRIANTNGVVPDFSELSSLLNVQIIPDYIGRKLHEFGLESTNVKLIISEKNLRNVVSLRCRNSRSKTWLGAVDTTLVLSLDSHPLCIGIMFAFFEKVAEKGYGTIKFFTEAKYQRAILKGWTLFKNSQQRLKYLRSKISSVQYFTVDRLLPI